MKKIEEVWNWLIYARTNNAMYARTGVEAVLAYISVHLPEIFGLFAIPDNAKTLMSGLMMVIFTWIIGCIRGNTTPNKEESK